MDAYQQRVRLLLAGYLTVALVLAAAAFIYDNYWDSLPPEARTRPTETPPPTRTRLPTQTPRPTNTPTPTDTPEPTNTPRPSATPPPTETPTPAPRTMYFCGIDLCLDDPEYGQLVNATGILIWNNPDPDRDGVNRTANHHDAVTAIRELRVGDFPGGLWFELSDGGWTNDLWLTEAPCTGENLDEFSHLCWGGLRPTVTPTPGGSGLPVSIQGVSTYVDSIDALHLVGEVRNQSDQNLRFVEITATFYDADNQVLATQVSYTDVDIVEAGGLSPFELILFDPPDGIASHKLDVEWDTTPNTPLMVEVLSHSASTDATGAYHVVGEVRNPYDFGLEFIEVVGTFYDAAGSVVRVEFTYADRDSLPAGETSPFELILFDPPEELSGYGLQTQAERD